MPEQDIFEDEVEVLADVPDSPVIQEYTSSVEVGNVETLDYGENAYVTNTGTATNAVLNFGLPKGASVAFWGQIEGTLANQTDLQTIINSLTSRILALESTLPETGTIVSCLKNSMAGYILCNGQAVSRETYANLFDVIGTTFGGGDGTTTFNVPDYRGCFLRGLGGNSESNTHTKQPMAAPNIIGKLPNGNERNDYTPSGAFYKVPNEINTTGWDGTGRPNVIGFDASRYNSVYGAANEIRPVNYAVNFFIKY